MRKFKLALIAATSAIAITSGAYAADASDAGAASTGGYAQGSGWYVSGSTGLAFLENAHNKANGYSFDSSPSNPGFDVTGAIGKEFGNGFRAEGELGYRQIGLDHLTFYGGGFGSGSAGGDANALSVMGNGYFDFDTGTRFKPYVGAGIGFARVALDDVTVNGRSVVDDSDVDFAYQAMAGVGYQVNTKGTLFLGYRYFAVDDPAFNAAAGGQIKGEMATHNIEVGYRLAF